MNLYGENIEFPGTLHLSFSKLFDSIAKEVETASPSRKEYLQKILALEKEYPELRAGLDSSDLGRYREPVDMLMEVVFPGSLTLNEIKCASAPWDFNPFYVSERLKNLLDADGGEFNWEFEGFDSDQLYIAGCTTILGMHYQLPMKASRPFFIQLKNKTTGKVRHYRIAFNADFMEVAPTEKSKEISKEDYHELIDNYHDIELWKEKFPVGSWRFSGFNILNMMDLTLDRNIGEIEKDLLTGGPEGLTRLQGHMEELLEVPDLKISFVSLDGDTLIQGGSYRMTPMMMSKESEMDCKEMLCPYTYQELIVNDAPVAIPDVERFASRSKSPIAKNVKKSGMKSYFICPINYENQKLGFLELGSEVKGALNATKFVTLADVIPVLAVSGNRYYQEKQNRLEAIIQEECTTIHSSVKWRFIQEAFKHIKAEDRGEEHVFKDLVFKEVYPLYGQLDIRGSSVMRNEAVRKDMISQLNAVKVILEEILSLKPLPIYDELTFIVNEYLREVDNNMNSASEHLILSFLNEEIEPLFPLMRGLSSSLDKKIERYLKAVNNEMHLLYKERKYFDESVNTMNKVLAAYLDKKQQEAQHMFPHYFERYKTDGVEFNMYIGESIAPDKGFDYLLVKNLRLWQLMVIVEMEREFYQLNKTLKKKLDVASLILAYNNPLSIHFRMDEKRFDVDGAYNARYEIIKKRIDKAHIKGTSERITTPNKIVVIYTSEEIEREYIRYFQFLQNKGYLMNDVELLEVEDLQGVTGLKALRVKVDYDQEPIEAGISMEEVIAEMEGQKR